MRIQFCGADRTVTGSSHLLEINGRRILLDMGLYQGRRSDADVINHSIPPGAKSIDAVVLSHGHLDHCGRLPTLVRAGFHGPIYCTPATAEVARVVLNDSAMIQMENIEYINARARTPAEKIAPLYTPNDIPPVLKLFNRIAYEQKTDLGNGVSFTFYDAGHILGSAFVLVEWTEGTVSRRLLFTGDVGRYHTPILRDPSPVPGVVDHLITESTYGDNLHAPIEQIEPELLDAVKFCIERKSRLLIPSFAVGRTQTVLWYLQRFIQAKQIPLIPIFIDSPMGIEITKITTQFRENYDRPTLEAIGTQDIFAMSHVTFTATSEQSKKINSQPGPCVIIASSPTCEFGRILHHLKNSADHPDDLVVFVGYIPPETLGRRLQDGQRHVRILDRWYDVKFQVRTIHGLSAHADYSELLRFLQPTLNPKTTAWVVHGEVPQSEGFARRLLAAGIGRTIIPAMDTSAVDGAPAAAAQNAPAVSETGE